MNNNLSNIPNFARQNEMKQKYNQEITKECSTQYLIFDDELKEWFGWAKRALKFATPPTLAIRQEGFIELIRIDENVGINLNQFAILCNNIEHVSAFQFEVSVEFYAKEILQLNARMAVRWQQAIQPLQRKVNLRLQISNPNMNTRNIIN